MNYILASTLVLLLTFGSLDCYYYQQPYQGRINEENIIRMPSVRSYNQPEQNNYATPCGSMLCMNGGQCQYNPYNNQPSCACRSPYFGNQCQFGQPSRQSTNLCRVFDERNMNICQNGGQCVYVADGKVACICPTTHKGLFCELPVYLPCNGDPSKTCHRDHGVCDKEGNCVCDEGYTGPRCDKVEACKTGYCLNGAECEEIDEEPYRKCICRQNYFGRRCEHFGLDFGNGTVKKYNRSCNLTISVLNNGGYVARLAVDFDDLLSGKRRTVTPRDDFPLFQTRTVTVPFYSENLNVRISTTFGEQIVNDKSLVNDLPCNKCYKVWGPIGNTRWDYVRC